MRIGWLEKLKSSKFATQFLVYLGSGALAKLIPFLILPLIANKLGPDEFGRVSNFNVLVQFFVPFLLLKQEEYYKVYYFKLNRSRYQEYFANSVIFSFVIAIIIILLIPFIDESISVYFKIDKIWTRGAILTSLGISLFLLRDTILRFDERAEVFSAFQIGFTVITSLLALIFVIKFNYGWKGRISATVLSSLIFIMISLWFFYKNGFLRFRLSLNSLKDPLKFSLPLMPQALTPLARGATDKLFITNYVSLTANGVYSIAITFSLVFEMIIEAIQNAYLPRLFKLLKQMDSDSSYDVARRIIKELIIGIAFMAVLLLVGYVILRLLIIYSLDESYRGALIFLPFILLNVFLNVVNRAQIQLILNTGNTIKLGYNFIVIAVIHISISAFLVQIYGVMGVIIALLLASSVRTILFTRLFLKTVAFPWKKILR